MQANLSCLGLNTFFTKSVMPLLLQNATCALLLSHFANRQYIPSATDAKMKIKQKEVSDDHL
jgi:hypothetical protein